MTASIASECVCVVDMWKSSSKRVQMSKFLIKFSYSRFTFCYISHFPIEYRFIHSSKEREKFLSKHNRSDLKARNLLHSSTKIGF